MVAIFRKTKKRGGGHALFFSIIMGMVALALIGFLAISNWRINKNRQALEDEINKSKDQIQMLQDRQATLKSGIDQAQSDDFQEEKLRDQGYKKPGEEVIAVLPGDNSAPGAKSPDETQTSNFWMSIWQKIKNLK